MKKDSVRTLLGLVIAAAFLSVVLVRLDWDNMREVFSQMDWQLLIPAWGLLVLHYLAKGLRWRVLLIGRESITRVLSCRLTVIGFFMNNIIPARLGELVRPYLLSVKHPRLKFTFALATVFGDKVFDLIGMVTLLLVSVLFIDAPSFVSGGIVALTGVALLVLAASVVGARWSQKELASPGQTDSFLRRIARIAGRFETRVYESLLSFMDGLSVVVVSSRRAVVALFHTATSFGLLVTATWFSARALHIDIDLMSAVFIVGITGIGFMIPGAPTNAGSFHFFSATALEMAADVTWAEAVSFAIIVHLTQVVSVSIMGAVAMIGLDISRHGGLLAMARRAEKKERQLETNSGEALK